VEWYPWGPEAFEQAQKEDKPVFLSIGYATCHWCHVMEHESFENEQIAAMMNEAFICIKVDREERPDIDSIYMTVCQMMTGSGGWPLTIIMTPDKKPFHAATYIPPEQRYGRIGMVELIPRITAAWQNQRQQVLESAEQITGVLGRQQAEQGGDALSPALLQQGLSELVNLYDETYGGFGMQPKFPTPHRLIYLLRQGGREHLDLVEHTLLEMRKGGIFDQVGYGFHRYSTDRQWLLPHFEKMLYDQALLALAYSEACEKTGNALYRRVAEEIFRYVLRDMTAPEGGFYSAEDADSEGEEGRFYIWSAAEMQSLLGDGYEQAARLWNIQAAGNFRDESTGEPTGMNIPHLSALPDDGLEQARSILFKEREKRIHPLKDTKVLADWNGLMIAAFARAGRVFGDAQYIEAARKANAFVESGMRGGDGRLWHRWREGHTAVPGQLDDYAFMTFGLLELYDATLDPVYLETALQYNDVLTGSFSDRMGGGYFITAEDAEPLIVRPKELYDGAVPSGNSVQMLNLLRLARLTGRPGLEEQAVESGRAFSSAIKRSPSNYAQALVALRFATADAEEVVLVGRRGAADTQQMLEYLKRGYNPDRILLFKDPADDGLLSRIAPFTEGMAMQEGRATVYICRGYACEPPVNTMDGLKKQLKQSGVADSAAGL
jgi:uncharacterized protein YyaL (SSP411 family)